MSIYGDRGRAVLFAFLTFVVIAGCERAESAGTVTTGVGSPSSLVSPTPSSVPSAFLTGGCTYPVAGGTRTQPVHDTFQTSISVPAGWTREDTSWTDLPFRLTAPATYQFQPTTIKVTAPWPTDSPQSASTALDQMVKGVVTVTAAPQPCTVGNDPAAVLSFTNGSTVGYVVLWIHFELAYELLLEGVGGVDQRAVQDAKGVLASVTYAHDVAPPSRTFPSPTR
jgi:hypothetical protein